MKCAGIRYYVSYTRGGFTKGDEVTQRVINYSPRALTVPVSSFPWRQNYVWVTYRRCQRKVVIRLPRVLEGSVVRSDSDAFCRACAEIRLAILEKQLKQNETIIKNAMKLSDSYKRVIKKIKETI